MPLLATIAERRVVDIGVTRDARRALRRRLVVAAVVTRLARDPRVAVRERDHRMAAALDRRVTCLPALRVVTVRAALRLELALVRIGVARIAGRELQRLPLRRRAVALVARDRHVLSGE